MKAVILAAGKGTRMGNLSQTTPKPMLKVLDKTLLEHKLDSLPASVTDVIIVVGHLKELIIETLGTEKAGKRIEYVVQDELRGTGHSLSLCREQLQDEEKFLVLMGDDIYTHEDMETCIKTPWSVLVFELPSIKGKAEIVLDERGCISKIQEKTPTERSGLVCAGMYSLTPQIFDYPLVAISDTEFGLPQTIVSAREDFDIRPVISKNWIQITEPADLIRAEELLRKHL